MKNRKQRVVLGSNYSEWGDVWSGVPQGSVLGPLLFVIFINDLPESLSLPLKMYADDSKLLTVLKCDNDKVKMRQDIDSIARWCCTWSMKLNSAKCKVMHIGKNNEKNEYSINDGISRTILATTEMERDLGIFIRADGKWSDQVNSAASKANRTLGMMKNTFKCWSDEIVRIIYPTFIRPHLEFASSVWNPNRKKDIDTLEKVQRRATKTLESRHLSYENRIKKLGLTTLEQRRHRGDFIQCYKLVHGLDKVNWCIENKIQAKCKKDLNNRRHNLQLTREIVQKCESRHSFLMNRIATP